MTEDKLSKQKPKDADFSRRAFIKTALIGGVAVASGAVIAKKVSSLSPNKNPNNILNDDLQQDTLMKGKEYVLMTSKEKEQMVRMFEDEYYKQV